MRAVPDADERRMKFLTVDIETVPQARFTQPINYRRISPNGFLDLDEKWLKDESTPTSVEGISQAICEGEAALAGTGCAPGLHPTTCHVVQVSFGWRDDDGQVGRRLTQWDDFVGDGQSGADAIALEKFVLTEAFRWFKRAAKDDVRLVTFNGKSFDLPVLRARAAILGLQVPKLPWRNWLYPWDDGAHADLRILLTQERKARGTLQAWAEGFGIHAEEHGHEVWSWVCEENWKALRDYGFVEALTLIEIYERLAYVL